MMSHEFRTPLETSLMFMNMILPYIKEAHGLELIELIKSQISLLLSLVNDILDLKLIKNNQFERKINQINPFKTILFVKKMFLP